MEYNKKKESKSYQSSEILQARREYDDKFKNLKQKKTKKQKNKTLPTKNTLSVKLSFRNKGEKQFSR